MNLRNSKSFLCGLFIILLLGILLRLYPSAGFNKLGFDENLYRMYVNMVDAKGITAYPNICEAYIVSQAEMPSAILPPTRFLYIFCGYLFKCITGMSALIALHWVSCIFSILTLFLTAIFTRRVSDEKTTLGVTAFMAVAPTQIHMSQHALIDGFFAFWALMVVWSLWECLKAPQNRGWLILYGTSLALMVMTKENAAFVYIGILGLIASNRWFKFGTISSHLLLVTFLGPLLGLTILIYLAGGVTNFIDIYRLLVSKAYQLDYAIKTGDGPWYRYLVDLLLVSPIIFLLAIGNIFQLNRKNLANWYCLTFLILTYLIMANIKYGMNLRYTNMWDMPLRFLAFSQLLIFTSHFRRHQWSILIVLCAGICALELRNYQIFFMENDLYELASEGLVRSLKIVK